MLIRKAAERVAAFEAQGAFVVEQLASERREREARNECEHTCGNEQEWCVCHHERIGLQLVRTQRELRQQGDHGTKPEQHVDHAEHAKALPEWPGHPTRARERITPVEGIGRAALTNRRVHFDDTPS
jgi:hypothetical protein